MAEHYVEDYLVSLGFDLDSDAGQKYLDMLKQIDKGNKGMEDGAEKSDKAAQSRSKKSKARAADTKKEINAIAELQKSFKQVSNVWTQASNGNVFGAFTSGIEGARAFKAVLDEIQKFTASGVKTVEVPKVNAQPKAEPIPTEKNGEPQPVQNAETKPQNVDVEPSTPRSTSGPPAHEKKPTKPQAVTGLPDLSRSLTETTVETQKVAAQQATQTEPQLPSPPQAESLPMSEILTEPQKVVLPRTAVHEATRKPTEVTTENSSEQPVDSRKIDKSKKAFDDLEKSVKATGKDMTGLTKTATQLFGKGLSGAGTDAGITAGAGLGAEAAEAATGITAIGGAAAIAAGGIAALAVTTTVAAYSIADGASTAYTNVESMAAQMWITDSSALKLSNTLSAMGKTTADLSTIALNPTLMKQFDALQEYQKTELQLPSNFADVNEQWAESVQLPMEKIKLMNQYMGQLTSYNIEKTMIGPMERLTGVVSGVQSGLLEMGSDLDKLGKSITGSAWYKAIAKSFSNMAKETSKVGPAALGTKASEALSGKSGSNSKKASHSSSSAASNPSINQVYTVPSYSNLAPNSTSNSSTSNSHVTYYNNPQITVHASSSDAQTIAQSTSAAVQQANNEAALIRTIQGANR